MINENTSGLDKVFLCGEREIFEGFISNKPMELPNLRFLKESPNPQIELVNATGYYFSNFVEAFSDFGVRCFEVRPHTHVLNALHLCQQYFAVRQLKAFAFNNRR